jgi:hypothetical protein
MLDINQELKSELSKLVNNIKMNSQNKQKHLKTQQKIKKLQQNQKLLLQRIEQLSKMI